MRPIKGWTLASMLLLALGTAHAAAPEEATVSMEMIDPAYIDPAHVGEPCPTCGGAEAGQEQWYFFADALFLDRSVGSGQILVVTTATGAPLLSANSFNGFDFNSAVGPRLTVGGHLNQDWAGEVVYFGLYDQRASTRFLQVGLPFGFTQPSALFNYNYNSDLQNAEFNLRRWFGRFSALAGFRYLSLDENMVGSFLTPNVGITNQNFNSSNELYGFQVGGNWRCVRNDQLAVDVGSKIGVFGNDSGMNVSNSGPLINAATSANRSETAFVAEIGILGSLRVCNHFWIRGGYQMMWIDGVALAPNQIRGTGFLTGAASTVVDASVFYHGAVAGAEFRW